MPSKYGKEFAVPKEFPSVLKAFTREVLRSQPSNIYEFGAEYFTELVSQADAAAAGGGGMRELSSEELAELLSGLFAQADADGSGALSMKEFKTVLESAELSLSPKEINRVLRAADSDGNGEISYEEFIPLGVELVHTMYAKEAAATQAAEEENAARLAAQDHLVHGMTKEQVESVMAEIFHKSDADGSGALDVKEFKQCCKDAAIGLTKAEINQLMFAVDVDGDGQITWEEFVPICFEMLVEILKDQLLDASREPSELEEFLLERFAEADFSQTGFLGAIELKTTIKECDFGLSDLQLHSILSQAAWDEEGLAEYKKFARTASELIYKLLDPEAQYAQFMQVQEIMEGGVDFDLVHGLSQDAVADALASAFAPFDPDGTGLVAAADMRAALTACTLQLSPSEMNTMMSLAAASPDGSLFYAEIVGNGYYVLQYLAQQDAISA